jgi:hypothetical protein
MFYLFINTYKGETVLQNIWRQMKRGDGALSISNLDST